VLVGVGVGDDPTLGVVVLVGVGVGDDPTLGVGVLVGVGVETQTEFASLTLTISVFIPDMV
jgi:hypothetical protein